VVPNLNKEPDTERSSICGIKEHVLLDLELDLGEKITLRFYSGSESQTTESQNCTLETGDLASKACFTIRKSELVSYIFKRLSEVT